MEFIQVNSPSKQHPHKEQQTINQRRLTGTCQRFIQRTSGLLPYNLPCTPPNGNESQARVLVQGKIPKRANTGRSKYEATSKTIYCIRVPCSPKRTASVCLPAARSASMSRKLLTTRISTINQPMGNDIHQACALTEPACTKYVPATAATPKKMKTNKSPNP